jgi:hypothetical protein
LAHAISNYDSGCRIRVLMNTFGPRGWRKLHNEELCGLYLTSNVISMVKSRRVCAGHVARMEEMRVVYTILVGKTEVNMQLQ